MRWGLRARRLLAVVGVLVLAGLTTGIVSANAAMVSGHGDKHRTASPAQQAGSASPTPQAQYPNYAASDQHGSRNGNGSQRHNKHRTAAGTSPRPNTATHHPVPAAVSSPSPVSRGIPHSDFAYRAPSPPDTTRHTATSGSTSPGAPASYRPDVARDRGSADVLATAFAHGVTKGGAFPAGLLVAAFLFLALQGRLDRSDAKLSMAQVASDDGLEFAAPPSRRDGSAGTANQG